MIVPVYKYDGTVYETEIPDNIPEPTPESENDVWAQLDAAYMEGVNSVE